MVGLDQVDAVADRALVFFDRLMRSRMSEKTRMPLA
jgi:hypothetical protein